jgi:hypothetical protein
MWPDAALRPDPDEVCSFHSRCPRRTFPLTPGPAGRPPHCLLVEFPYTGRILMRLQHAQLRHAPSGHVTVIRERRQLCFASCATV